MRTKSDVIDLSFVLLFSAASRMPNWRDECRKIDFFATHGWIHPEQFRRCVNRYAGNYKVYNFPCWDQFLAMAFAQITYRESLADIEVCLRSRPDQLYRMGFRSTVAHSTLADANSARDWRNPGRTALITAGFLPTELEARLRLALP